MSADVVADMMVERVLADAPWHEPGGASISVAAMVNNLGNSTAMEVAIVTRRVVAQLRAFPWWRCACVVCAGAVD